MTSKQDLTDTQSLILSMASQRDDGRLVLPASLKGAAGPAVLRALERRALIVQAELDPTPTRFGEGKSDHLQPYRITTAGLDAIGIEHQEVTKPAPAENKRTEGESDSAPDPANAGGDCAVRRRSATKREQLIALLMEPSGATTATLIATLGWLPHTLRAALSGLRKDGHEVVHERTAQREPAYRIVAATNGEAPR